MLYKLRLPLYLQPLDQPQHEQLIRTRMLELRDSETRNMLSVFRGPDPQGMCEMVSDGGGRFTPADIVSVHTLSLLASSRVAHDHATDNYYPDQHNTQLQ